MEYQEFNEYQNNQNTTKKRGPLVAVLLIIIFILLLIILFLGFNAYNLKVEIEILNSKLKDLESFEEDDVYISDFYEKDDISTQLNINSVLVQNSIEKIDFPTHAIASIYAAESFNLANIPNDLVLRLGWTKAEKELIKNDIDNLGEYKQKTTIENFDESVLEIFGTRVNYIDNSFTNINVPTFHAYYENRGAINFTGTSYIASYTEEGGIDSPFIHQEVDKVLKYDSRLEIHVKTAFIDTEIGTDNYIIYRDFQNDEFVGKVSELTSEQFETGYASDGDRSSFTSNIEILEIADQLDTYVYTFTIDGNNGNYYLSAFSKVK